MYPCKYIHSACMCRYVKYMDVKFHDLISDEGNSAVVEKFGI